MSRFLVMLMVLVSRVFAQDQAVVAIDDATAAIGRLVSCAHVGGAESSVVQRERMGAERRLDETLSMIAERSREGETDALVALRVRVELARADLLLAAALATANPAGRADLLEEAQRAFGSVRIGQPDHGLRLLGYLGGARVMEAKDDPAGAVDMLRSLRSQLTGSPSLARSRLIAEAALQETYVDVIQRPADVEAEILQLRSMTRGNVNDADLAWITAVASSRRAEQLAAQGADADSVSNAAASAAAAWRSVDARDAERLGALALLEPLGVELTFDEHVSLGALVAGAGRHDDALARWRAAGITPDDLSRLLAEAQLSIDEAILVARSLDRAGEVRDRTVAWSSIADAWDGPLPAGLLMRMALARDQLAQAEPTDEHLLAAADDYAALLGLIEAPDQRVQVLIRWASLGMRVLPPGRVVATLAESSEDVDQSLTLRRLRLVAVWDEAVAQDRFADAFASIEAELTDLVADAAVDPDEHAASSLLLASLYHTAGRNAQALEVLRGAGAASGAAALEIDLLVDLELIGEASSRLGDDFDAEVALPAMRVAEALARDPATCARAATIAMRSRSLVAPTSADFVTLTRRAAGVLKSCDRDRVAIPLLESLLTQGMVEGPALDDVVVALADLHAGAGSPQAALDLLETYDVPAATPVIRALRGRLLAHTGRHAEAVEPLISSWKELAPGSSAWCDTTLSLVDALSHIEGRHDEAADIIRMLDVLYPDACAQYRAELDAIRTRLNRTPS